MFDQKCSKCGKKIKETYDFCPICGHNLKSNFDEEDYGLLGKNDFVKEKGIDPFAGFGFAGLPIGKLIKGAMKELPSMLKMLEKEMSESLNESEKRNKGNLNVQFFVNGKKVSPNAVPVLKKGEPVKKIERKERKVSKEKMELLAKFPKVEPESEVRRLSGRVIYNIYVPGVETVEDVFVNQLENSIEVKALGKDKVYSKILNLKLPLKGYDLVEDNLVLELGAE